MDLGDARSARLVSYKSVAKLFERVPATGSSVDDVTSSDVTHPYDKSAPAKLAAAAKPPNAVAEPDLKTALDTIDDAKTEFRHNSDANRVDESPMNKGPEVVGDDLPTQSKSRVRTSPISRIVPSEDTEAAPSSSQTPPKLKAVMPPRGFPDSLLLNLREQIKSQKLDRECATLIQIEYVDGQSEYVVAFSGTPASTHDALEALVSEVFSLSKRPDIELGIAFFDANDSIANRISRIGTPLS